MGASGRRGAIYSVEEVSERLGIPRPTLYRYLRDYEVPHVRQGGRIQIPEDSFDRIREARDLHREGLGTEAVRRRLDDQDAGLAERLDGISDALEDLRENLGPTHGMSSHEALRTILARQTLLISAVSDLTGMVEGLASTNGHTRRKRIAEEPTALEALRALPPAVAEPEANGSRQAPGEARGDLPSRPSTDRPLPDRQSRFGSRRRRRRWGVLAGAACVVIVGAGALTAGALQLLPGPEPETVRQAGATSAEASRPGQPEVRSERRDGTANASSGQTAGETSTDPRSAAVPDVSGLEAGAAAERLRQRGFEVPGFALAPGLAGEVIGTEPASGVEVEPGTAVTLVLGDGSETSGG